MPCDAQTLENLAAVGGDTRLSDYDLQVCTAYIYGNAASLANAQAAVNLASSNGYTKLSDRDLDSAMLYAICSTCEASAALSSAIGRGYEKFSDRGIADILKTKGGGQPVQTIIASAMAGGYGRLSMRMLKEVTVAAACTSNCSAQSAISGAQSSGYSKLSDRSLADCILSAACGP